MLFLFKMYNVTVVTSKSVSQMTELEPNDLRNTNVLQSDHLRRGRPGEFSVDDEQQNNNGIFRASRLHPDLVLFDPRHFVESYRRKILRFLFKFLQCKVDKQKRSLFFIVACSSQNYKKKGFLCFFFVFVNFSERKDCDIRIQNFGMK